MRSMATQTDVNNHRNNQRHSAHYPLGSSNYADEKVRILIYCAQLLKKWKCIKLNNSDSNLPIFI